MLGGQLCFPLKLHAGGLGFRLYDGSDWKTSIDEMVGAWCFGCLSGPPGFTCWISFAPVFRYMIRLYAAEYKVYTRQLKLRTKLHNTEPDICDIWHAKGIYFPSTDTLRIQWPFPLHKVGVAFLIYESNQDRPCDFVMSCWQSLCSRSWIGLSMVVFQRQYLLVTSWFICFRRWCIDKLGVFHANQISMCLDPHLN